MSTPGPTTRRLALVLRRAITEHNLSEGPLLLAVSGGTDSLAMLLAASSFRVSRGELVVAHYSHGIRPSAEHREASLVRRTATSRNIRIVHERARVSATEAAARDARYAFLARAAREVGAAAVLTAHTQDDQAETVLLRLMRGTGLRGASAMRPLTVRETSAGPLTLLRPLLTATRDETSMVCAEAGVRPASDGTNRSLAYARNRVRRRVLPELKRLNPEASAALSRFARTAAADDDLLKALARERASAFEDRGVDHVTWVRMSLAKLPSPLFSRVLQDAWEHLHGPGVALTESKLDQAARLVHSTRGGALAMGKGTRLVVGHERCWLGRITTPAKSFDEVPLAIPGETRAGPWLMRTTCVEATVSPGAYGPMTAAIDREQTGGDLYVRPRRTGDRFQPLGSARPIRLQNLLVNAKVPRSERDSLPLLVSSRGIAWVGGLRVAEWAKVTPETRLVLLIEATATEDRPRASPQNG